MSPDLEVTERQTYNLLEYLGDIGGLFDALRYMGIFIISPFVSFSLRSKLLNSLFRFVTSVQTDNKFTKDTPISRLEATQKMTWDLQRAKKIEEERYVCQPCCKRTLYKRMLNKSTISIRKELDLVKFMRRMRLFTYATLA